MRNQAIISPQANDVPGEGIKFNLPGFLGLVEGFDLQDVLRSCIKNGNKRNEKGIEGYLGGLVNGFQAKRIQELFDCIILRTNEVKSQMNRK